MGAGLSRLYTKDLFNVRVAIPSLPEQEFIVNTIKGKAKKIDALISEKRALIEDLSAYKKSLIYEVVTGKRRVC